jgi:hypothetical protein
MDAQEKKMLTTAEIAAAVLGKGTSVLLVDLDGPMPSEEVREKAKAAGYVFCGTLTFKDGLASSKAESVDCLGPMSAAIGPFVDLVAEKLRARAADPLERWYQLPDTREN